MVHSFHCGRLIYQGYVEFLESVYQIATKHNDSLEKVLEETGEEVRRWNIYLLAYKKYLQPKDEATKDARKKALMRLGTRYSLRECMKEVG